MGVMRGSGCGDYNIMVWCMYFVDVCSSLLSLIFDLRRIAAAATVGQVSSWRIPLTSHGTSFPCFKGIDIVKKGERERGLPFSLLTGPP